MLGPAMSPGVWSTAVMTVVEALELEGRRIKLRVIAEGVADVSKRGRDDVRNARTRFTRYCSKVRAMSEKP